MAAEVEAAANLFGAATIRFASNLIQHRDEVWQVIPALLARIVPQFQMLVPYFAGHRHIILRPLNRAAADCVGRNVDVFGSA